MTRPTLYSSSRAKAAGTAAPPPVPEKKKIQWRAWLRQNRLPMLAAVPGLAALAFVLLQLALAPPQVIYTQEDIDAAVTKALETVPLPSHSTRAYEAVRGSIVRVRAFYDGPDGGEIEGSVGTGVVILDKGVILTNIHVVAGAKRIGLDVRRRHGIRRRGHRHAARGRSRGAAGERRYRTTCRPRRCSPRAASRRAISSPRSVFRSASAPRCPRAWSRG